MTAAADRHLLFGLLALQNGLIDQGQLMLAFHTWTHDKSRSLADHLEARGDLTAAKRALPACRFFFHVMASLAQMERELLAERTAPVSTRRGGGAGSGRKRRMTPGKVESARKLLMIACRLVYNKDAIS